MHDAGKKATLVGAHMCLGPVRQTPYRLLCDEAVPRGTKQACGITNVHTDMHTETALLSFSPPPGRRVAVAVFF